MNWQKLFIRYWYDKKLIYLVRPKNEISRKKLKFTIQNNIYKMIYKMYLTELNIKLFLKYVIELIEYLYIMCIKREETKVKKR